jgi:hypothetical protein
MTKNTIEKLAEKYRATGRVAFIYPRLQKISLNGGRMMSWQEGAQAIKECEQALCAHIYNIHGAPSRYKKCFKCGIITKEI